tara:strand:- start:202 stop:504 length:303 start_codon:yes stop_codon:yes gene_type:complete
MSGPIDDKIRAQINALIQDEIQENINEYLDDKEQIDKAIGFSGQDDDKQLKVNIPTDEIDKLIKEYKKIKKRQRSNLSQIKKLGLVDKHGKSLGGEDVKH